MCSEGNVVKRMLVIVLNDEHKATQGRNALLQLDKEGSIVVYAWALILKNADQTTTIKQSINPGPLGTLVGTSLGGLIGLLAGPAGLAIGCAVGLVAGNVVDMNKAIVGAEFIDDVSKELQPNRFALLAEIEEDSTTPVDSCMEPLGGIVFRRAVSDVEDPTHKDHIAAMKADLAQMKAELIQAHADRKAKLQEKINQLDSKIQEQLRQAYERREEAELEEKAEAEALEDKAAALKAKEAETNVETESESEKHEAQHKDEEQEKMRA
jgi:uncharacterized membrane protein